MICHNPSWLCPQRNRLYINTEKSMRKMNGKFTSGLAVCSERGGGTVMLYRGLALCIMFLSIFVLLARDPFYILSNAAL